MGKDTLLCLSIVGNGGQPVANIYGQGTEERDAGFPPDVEARANAALIAAAPELLAALELVLKNGYRMPCQGQDDGDKIIMRYLAAAIAKAKGE